MEVKSSIARIFESVLRRQPLFRNKDALRHTYTPEELPHREEEISSLATILAPALKGETPSNVLIYGKSGTGKTIVSKFVCMELREMSRRYGSPVSMVYLNCEVTDTQYRVLANLANSFGGEVPFTGWPTDKVYSAFKKAVEERGHNVIIILDEIDRLVSKGGDRVLYSLTRINSELVNARVSIVGISNNLKFTDYLDTRVQSSLSGEEIVFKPYNAKQLEDILRQRAELAFEPGVLDDYVIPLCAALAAREHGDARRALDLLRVSGEVAERENAEVITEKHVRKASEKIEKDNVVEAVRSMPTHSKILLYAVILLEENMTKFITTGKIYQTYRYLCREVAVDPLTQRRISDLLSELDMLGILNSTVISKGRYGRTREIKLAVPLGDIKRVVEEDPRLSRLSSASLRQKTLD